MTLPQLGVRLAQIAAMVLALSFVLFGLLSFLPGDPVDQLILSNPNVRPEDVAALKEQRGLDRPWPVRWWRWLVGVHAPLSPPRAPALPPLALELDMEGRAVARVKVPLQEGEVLRAPASMAVHGEELLAELRTPGVHALPFAVRDRHGLEDAGVWTVYVAPSISSVPLPPEDGAPTLEGSDERQAAGSTESAVALGRASEAERMASARAVGGAGVEPVVRTWARGTALQVEQRSFCGAQPCTLAMDTSAFVERGRDVRFGDVSHGRGVSPVALVVDHGAVGDPSRFERGALFALLGDTGALGWSQTYKRPVWELLFGGAALEATGQGTGSGLARRIQGLGPVQNTLLLMGSSMALAALLAVLLGTWAAARRGGAVDRVVGAVAVLGVSMPAFWIGIMLIVVLAGMLRWFPAGGAQTPGLEPLLGEVLADRLQHMVLPVTVLCFAYASQWLRVVRASVLEVLPQGLVRTARAKGASQPRVLAHALRNALLPFITVVALSVPAVFSGALLTETVFSWPGVGRLQYDAILNNDSYLAIVVLLVSSTLVMLGSLAADLLYAFVDPRVRARSSTSKGAP